MLCRKKHKKNIGGKIAERNISLSTCLLYSGAPVIFQLQTPELSQAFVEGGYERDVTSSCPMSSHSASANTLFRLQPCREGKEGGKAVVTKGQEGKEEGKAVVANGCDIPVFHGYLVALT